MFSLNLLWSKVSEEPGDTDTIWTVRKVTGTRSDRWPAGHEQQHNLPESRDRRAMNTVVFPAPVGMDTVLRCAPAASAVWHAWMQASWYGRRMTGDVRVELCKVL